MVVACKFQWGTVSYCYVLTYFRTPALSGFLLFAPIEKRNEKDRYTDQT